MNLIEAIKSGEFIRNAESSSHGRWHDPKSVGYGYTPEEVLSTAWEIQEPPVMITMTQFWEAYSNVMKDYWQANHAYPVGAYAPVEVIVPALARKLGLEGE